MILSRSPSLSPHLKFGARPKVNRLRLRIAGRGGLSSEDAATLIVVNSKVAKAWASHLLKPHLESLQSEKSLTLRVVAVPPGGFGAAAEAEAEAAEVAATVHVEGGDGDTTASQVMCVGSGVLKVLLKLPPRVCQFLA